MKLTTIAALLLLFLTRILCGEETKPDRELKGRIANGIVTLSLENNSNTSIKIDRELAMLLTVKCFDEKGAQIEFEYKPRAPKPDTFEGRFITLGPKSRHEVKLDLKNGFKSFECAIGTLKSGGHTVSVYESIQCLPAGKVPSKIQISYGRHYGFVDGFRLYTGMEASKVELFDERLSVEMAWK